MTTDDESDAEDANETKQGAESDSEGIATSRHPEQATGSNSWALSVGGT
jgi:hypothetical protein